MHWQPSLALTLFLAHAVWGAPAPLETLDTLIARAAKNTDGVELELEKEGPLVRVTLFDIALDGVELELEKEGPLVSVTPFNFAADGVELELEKEGPLVSVTLFDIALDGVELELEKEGPLVSVTPFNFAADGVELELEKEGPLVSVTLFDIAADGVELELEKEGHLVSVTLFNFAEDGVELELEKEGPLVSVTLFDIAADGVELELEKEGSLVSVDMDMLFTQDEWDKLHNKNSTSGDSRHKRKATNDWSRRWTDKTIPYQIRDADFSSSEIDQIMGAMWEWSEHTCIRFKPATSSDWNKILIKDGHGCKSFVGMTGGRQYVMLAKTCRQRGLIIHELGHIIGFYHEHTRPDRDDHVTIVKENIPDSMFFNFEKFGWDVIGDYGVAYDYLSIMHYGPTAFSMNGGNTIQTKDPAYQTVIGNRNQLSFRDIKLANKMYGCSDHCGRSDSDCPGEGFVGKDCQCLCPGSPVKVCAGNSWTPETTTSYSKSYGWGSRGDDTWGEGAASWSSDEDNYDYDYDYENGDAPPIHTSSPDSRHGGEMIAICTDYHTKCQSWASRGFCTKKKFSPYMASTCKESCHTCSHHDDSVHGWHYDVTEAASCRDGHPRCQELSERGKCFTSLYRPFMALYCRQSCQLCPGKRQPVLPLEA